MMEAGEPQTPFVQVWREACQHIDFEQAVVSVARVVRRHVPLGRLVLYRFDSEPPRVTAFAGLWETWRDGDVTITTATLLTTEPNAEVRTVGHHRMPVLLTTPEARRAWLVEGPTPELLTPLADGLLTSRRAGG